MKFWFLASAIFIVLWLVLLNNVQNAANDKRREQIIISFLLFNIKIETFMYRKNACDCLKKSITFQKKLWWVIIPAWSFRKVTFLRHISVINKWNAIYFLRNRFAFPSISIKLCSRASCHFLFRKIEIMLHLSTTWLWNFYS